MCRVDLSPDKAGRPRGAHLQGGFPPAAEPTGPRQEHGPGTLTTE